MKTLITAKDIRDQIELENGLTAHIQADPDQDSGTPWDNDCGRGIVSEWTHRDKAPGERVLCSDRQSRRFYDFRATMQKARKEGWGLSDEAAAELTRKLGHQPAKGEILAKAVERDFEFLLSWCADEWHYLCVTVNLRNAEGEEVGRDSLCGVEEYADYWKECAAEMLNGLIEAHEKETAEKAHWEARDTETK